MSDIAHLLNACFVGLVAFYICMQTALTIAQVRSAEHAADKLPAAFRSSVPLAVHRKAADYTGETVQADLVSAYMGAIVCLLMTLGNGFNFLAAGTMAVLGSGLLSQFAMCFAVVLLLAIIDFPIAWWKYFRINERYGYEKTRSKTWIFENLSDTATGLLVTIPFLLGGLYILDISSYVWWIFAAIVTGAWLFWSIFIKPTWVMGYASGVRPMAQGALRDSLSEFLETLELPNTEIYTSPTPKGWRHGDAYFSRRPMKPRRLVIFEEAVQTLNEQELQAIVACAACRITRWHRPVRFFFFLTISTLFWWAMSLLAVWPDFYTALNIEPALAIIRGSPNPGLLMLIAVIVIPIVFYPLVLLIHAFTRMLDFDEDAFAVRTVGSKALIRALVKRHRDYRNTLTPSRFYSLANHIRPHVTQRITQAFIAEQKMKHAQHAAKAALEGDMAEQFSAVIAARRAERRKKLSRRWRARTLDLAERTSLAKRAASFNTLPGAAVEGNR